MIATVRTAPVEGVTTWAFDGEASTPYVGFDELRATIDDLYMKLAASVAVHDVRITPRSVSCYYVNSVPEVSATTLAVGVLTRWAQNIAADDPEHGYVGARLHACASPGEHSCASLVMVDSQDDGSPLLSIRVGREVPEQEDAITALSAAHDELIVLFKQHTSEALRKGWGER